MMFSSTLIGVKNGEITLNRSIAAELLRRWIDPSIAGSLFAAMSEMAKEAAVEGGLSALDTVVALAAPHYHKEYEKAGLPHRGKGKATPACSVEAGKLRVVRKNAGQGADISVSVAMLRPDENAGETK